mgnify:CR=1 FL=1
MDWAGREGGRGIGAGVVGFGALLGALELLGVLELLKPAPSAAPATSGFHETQQLSSTMHETLVAGTTKAIDALRLKHEHLEVTATNAELVASELQGEHDDLKQVY